jgi:rhodanese-related sulfurtransferase
MSQFVVQNYLLLAVFVASGCMVIWPEVAKLVNGGGGSEIGTLLATQLINQKNAVVVDVRDAAEYAAGHIPNSRHIPLGDLESRVGELSKIKNRPIVLTCRTGNRSGRAERILRKAGFENVYVLKGGVTAWSEASLPLPRSDGPGKAS